MHIITNNLLDSNIYNRHSNMNKTATIRKNSINQQD